MSRPTMKMRTFLKFWSMTEYDPKKKRECMLAAGYSPKTPAKTIERGAKGKLRDILDEEDMTVKALVREHKRIAFGAMNPTKPDMPNDNVRLRAINLGYGMHDVAPTQKVSVDSKESKDVTISLETIRKIEELKGEKVIDIKPEKDDNASSIEPL